MPIQRLDFEDGYESFSDGEPEMEPPTTILMRGADSPPLELPPAPPQSSSPRAPGPQPPAGLPTRVVDWDDGPEPPSDNEDNEDFSDSDDEGGAMQLIDRSTLATHDLKLSLVLDTNDIMKALLNDSQEDPSRSYGDYVLKNVEHLRIGSAEQGVAIPAKWAATTQVCIMT